MSPALRGSSEIQCFECTDAIEILTGIIFDFCIIMTNKLLSIQKILGGGEFQPPTIYKYASYIYC